MNVRLSPMLLALALAGCAGAGSSSAQPCPAILTPTVIAMPALLAPAPGATGVPVSGLTIVISGRPSPDARMRLVGFDNSTVDAGPFSPAPTADYPQAVGAAVPALNTHTSYSVFVFGTTPITPAHDCFAELGGPYDVRVSNGTFTTQ